MSHTINHQFVHFVWPTENLRPLIPEDSLSSLLAYIAGITKNLNGLLIAGSGTSNHLHMLINAPTHYSIAELARQIKSCSSTWYRKQGGQYSSFTWNEGYSAFSVSPESINNVKDYLSNETHRHTNLSFEEELTAFLKMQEIEFTPKFLTNTTYTKLYYHLVWSVKNRESLLNVSMQSILHQRIQEIIQHDGGKLYAAGNVADHIHLLVECPKNISTASLVQNLKTKTTHLIKSLGNRGPSNFCWQEGFGVFSVGKSGVDAVARYVNDQEKHHRVRTFDQELEWFKRMNGVA